LAGNKPFVAKTAIAKMNEKMNELPLGSDGSRNENHVAGWSPISALVAMLLLKFGHC
jgi:hypothetical protein